MFMFHDFKIYTEIKKNRQTDNFSIKIQTKNLFDQIRTKNSKFWNDFPKEKTPPTKSFLNCVYTVGGSAHASLSLFCSQICCILSFQFIFSRVSLFNWS